MTNDELRRVIEGGETFTIEFKGEEHKRLTDDELVIAVVCLANGSGGTILIGVEDDGRVTGSRPRHEGGVTDPARLSALVANRTVPPVRVAVELVDLPEGQVIVVRVPDELRPVGTSDGRYVRRAIGGDSPPACTTTSSRPWIHRRRLGDGSYCRCAADVRYG